MDLQALFTQVGRYFAPSGGWYHQRRTVQTVFIIGLASAAMTTAIILMWIFRTMSVEIRAAILGLCSLVAFVIIRAASFHHADRFLRENVIGLRWNAIFELGSIMFIASAGIWYWYNRGSHR